MKTIVIYAVVIAVAYKVVFFVLSLMDAANKCGVLEFCK